ncbi:glycosyltransferase [Massilia sp. Root335]|uniref:glycosyltransferase n=1 Tax=Massilia sp. Root335 TaxID=1736517 RepID=UPI0009E85759|nr:glycosyltransferase [Massilia sp. Root335]
MDVAFCSHVDDEYSVGLAALMRSLRQSNPHIAIPYIVCYSEVLSEASRRRIELEYPNIKYRTIASDLYQKCCFTKHRDWRMSPAFRYELFRVVDYEQLIYLDADMIIVGNIDELLAYRGDVAACSLPPGEGMEIKHLGGFNSGVLSLGKRVRTPEIWRKLMHVAEASPWSGNQTVLNLVLKDMYHELPSEFNVGSTRMTPEKLVSARIVHYVGKRKPWQSEEPFGVNQIRLAGQDMCDTLLRLWKKYAPEE